MTENERLLKQLTEEKTRVIEVEDKLQRTEELIDDQREAQDAQLKAKTKDMVNLEEELAIYKRRVSEAQQRMRQAAQKQASDNKRIENQMRKRDTEWNEAKLKQERQMQTVLLKRQ